MFNAPVCYYDVALVAAAGLANGMGTFNAYSVEPFGSRSNIW